MIECVETSSHAPGAPHGYQRRDAGAWRAAVLFHRPATEFHLPGEELLREGRRGRGTCAGHGESPSARL